MEVVMFDNVRGTIIGDILYPYEFWTEEKIPRKIDRGHFSNDDEAIAWFKAEHKEYDGKPVEMRCFGVV